jgi:hypothetical protein
MSYASPFRTNNFSKGPQILFLSNIFIPYGKLKVH